MRVSQECIDLVKKFEGFRARAYRCPAGVWTIGYGSTGGVMPGQRITREEAERWLVLDLNAFGAEVESLVEVPLEQHQFDALVSFTYNVGVGQEASPKQRPSGFKGSTLRRLLNQGKYAEAAEEFDKWVYANGRKFKGLEERRKKEKELFLGVKSV